MGIIRKLGRRVVLPVKKIENIVEKYYQKFGNDNPILDFGAGTLFWSEKFYDRYKKDIYSVDLLYNTTPPKIKSDKIHIFKDLSDFDDDIRFSMIFACDVFHHLGENELYLILEKFTLKADLIIIKDIEASNFWGNLQNKIHDFLINKQLVNNIYCKNIEQFLHYKNYKTQIFYIKKLGYPHFLLIGYK